ncbi:MAG: nitroreductase family protein [Bacteroidales bacterium]|nr:nitroreductase family protein [Bacteroidales bacterium]
MEAIIRRRSVRNYNAKALSEEHKTKLLQYIQDENNLTGPFGSKIRIVYKEVSNANKREKLGTYGFIKNAPAYLISVCQNTKESMLDLGFVFEKLVLFLQGNGLNTCWVGGTFHRKKLQLEQKFSSDEFIPVISPVGYSANSQHFVERIVRKGAKSDTRKNFDELFFNSDFNTKIIDPSTRELFEYLRLAPSASNKQPWRVVLSDNKIAHFFIERTPKYGNSLGYDIQLVDMGIALSHYLIVSGNKHVYIENPQIEPLNENSSYVFSVK